MAKMRKTGKKAGKKRMATPKQMAARRKFAEMMRSKTNKSKKTGRTTMRRMSKKSGRKMGGSTKMSFNGILKNGLNVFKDKRIQGVAKGAGVAAIIGPALDSAAPQVSGTLTQAGQRIALGVLGGGLEGGVGGIIAYAAQAGRLNRGSTGARRVGRLA